MTIIVYRDGVMAADTAVQQYDLQVGRVRKVLRGPDGCIYATTGKSCDGAAFTDWVEAGRPEDQKPKMEESFCALLVEKDGVVKQYCELLSWDTIEADFNVLGAGAEIAFGACAAGATARQAAEIAAKYHVNCGGEVQAIEL